MLNRVGLLAKLVSSRRRGSHTTPYTVFIGAGVSLCSGPSVFADVFAEIGAQDYNDFSERVRSLSPDERFALLRPRISVLAPSPGALLLARLALDGYFSLILTTNFDDLIERSLVAEGATSEDFAVYVNSPGSPIPDIAACVSRTVPPIHIVKLHGDVFRRSFALTDDETLQFDSIVEEMLRRHFSQNDCIVLGSSMRDLDLLRCFGGTGGSIWYVNPNPPQEYFASILKKRNCSSSVISGDYGQFEGFMRRLAGEVAGSDAPARTFSVETHKFIPVFLGMYERSSAPKRTNRWGTYFDIAVQGGARLCIFPFGVGVWHLTESARFSTITDIAINRRSSYSTILSDRDPVINSGQTRTLTTEGVVELNSLGSELAWKMGYVFSLLVLREPIWKNNEFHNALKMLACPTVLQAEDKEDLSRTEAVGLERQLLTAGFSYPDLLHFGVPGRGFGYASWAGLSYFEGSQQTPALPVSEIVEYEIALQAVWWSCHCLRKIAQDGQIAGASTLKHAARLTRRQLNNLKGISPTEAVDLRTMEEAIIRTSRVCEMADDALDEWN